MRIIAGEHKGRALKTPKGEGTRPTTDRVKEALMSSIMSRTGGFDGLKVLDAFAGSGSLSLEALSRGAASAVLCEQDRGALAAIEQNRALLGYEAQTRVIKADVFKTMFRWGGPFDLVFLDPPYAYDPKDIESFLKRLWDNGCLSSGCLVTYEHKKDDNTAVDEAFASSCFTIEDRRSWGETTIDFMTPDAARLP